MSRYLLVCETVGTTLTAGGIVFTDNTDANPLAYTPEIKVDTFVLSDLVAGGGGALDYNVDGGANTTLNQNGSLAFRKTTIAAGAPGAHPQHAAKRRRRIRHRYTRLQ